MGKKARQGFADRSKGGSLAEKSQGRKTDIFDSHTERIKVLLFGLIETPCHAACFLLTSSFKTSSKHDKEPDTGK